jgi:site-specific DNA recombinase
MNCAIYCRVSTDDQEREGTSLQTQLEACLDYCQKKGYAVARRFSEAYSGLTLDRPKLNELRDLIRTGDIDVIVIYCLDRLSRDPTHGVILTQELERFNVALEAVTETVDSTELGKLISYIRGFASKLEAEKIRERTMRGKLAHLKNGRLPQGTGIGIYGYKWDKTTGRRLIIDHEAEIVRKIFSMAIKGISTNQIAMSLNKSGVRTKSGSLWYPLTVRRILNNRTYTGKTYFGQTKRVSKTKVEAQPEENWILLPDITPPIITDEIFNQAQEALRNAKQARPLKPDTPYLLTGFIKCSKCGSPIGGTTLNGKYRYYQCRGARPTATRGKICGAGYIKADEIEDFVWERLVKLLSSPLTLLSKFTDMNYDSRRSILPMLDKQIKQLRNKLKTYPTKEKNLYDLLSHDSVTKDYVLDTVNKLKKSREEDELQLKQLLESRKKSAKARQITVKLTEFADTVRHNLTEDISLEKKRYILECLSVKILASPGNYRFTCFIDTELTSDYDEEIESAFYEKVKEFEAQHPEINFMDLIDHSKQVPEDTFIGKINTRIKKNMKNLVTIERTSA